MTRLCFLVAALLPAFSQDPARIGATRGRVSFPSGTQLAAGQHLRTGWNAFADLLLDPEHSVRVRGETEVDLIIVEPGRYHLAVTKGSVVHYVSGGSLTEVRIDTPNVWVTPSQPGEYEISVGGPSKSQVVANAGSVAVFAPQGHEWVNTGDKMLVRGDAANPQFKLVSALTIWKRLAIALSTLHIGGVGAAVGAGSEESASSESAVAKPSPPSKPAGESSHHSPPVALPVNKTEQPSSRGKL